MVWLADNHSGVQPSTMSLIPFNTTAAGFMGHVVPSPYRSPVMRHWDYYGSRQASAENTPRHGAYPQDLSIEEWTWSPAVLMSDDERPSSSDKRWREVEQDRKIFMTDCDSSDSSTSDSSSSSSDSDISEYFFSACRQFKARPSRKKISRVSRSGFQRSPVENGIHKKNQKYQKNAKLRQEEYHKSTTQNGKIPNGKIPNGKQHHGRLYNGKMKNSKVHNGRDHVRWSDTEGMNTLNLNTGGGSFSSSKNVRQIYMPSDPVNTSLAHMRHLTIDDRRKSKDNM